MVPEDKQLCPLRRVTTKKPRGLYSSDGVEVKAEFCSCYKERCAWWDDAQKLCGVLSLVDHLNCISIDLNEINEEGITPGHRAQQPGWGMGS